MSGLALTTPKPAATDEFRLTEMADRARLLARDINKNVGRILAALQIGDVSRQRAEHVQSGLALLDGLDRSANQLRLRAAGEMLLAAQLEAALGDYNQNVSKLLPCIEALASSAMALASLSDLVAKLGDTDDGLRDLKVRMAAAIQLVAEIQSADSAARYLAGRLTNNNGPVAIVGAAPPASKGHPLDHKASDFLDRIIYLEAAANDCVIILERLKDASAALMSDLPTTPPPSSVSTKSQKGVAAAAAAAERIKAIRYKAEDDIAVHAGKNTDILRLLDRSPDLASSDEFHGELEAGGYAGLNFTSPDLSPGDDAFSGELSVLLAKLEGLYTMGQEREVHRAFSRACGLETSNDPDASEDGLF